MALSGQTATAQAGTVPTPNSYQTFSVYASKQRSHEYTGKILELYKLGKYGIDPMDITGCNREGLETYSARANPSSELKALADQATNGLSVEQTWLFAVSIAEGRSDLLSPTSLPANEEETLAYQTLTQKQDSLFAYVLQKAASGGHMMALNEIGSSQLYCYSGVKQDLTAALQALERASQQGDEVAMLSVGKMYYSGLGTPTNRMKGKQLEDQAFELIIKKVRAQRKLDNR
jgi:TPR repeat protein